MLKDKLFIELFALIVFIALLHILAIEFSLYRLLWWFDVLVHFLAGLWVSGLSLWIYFKSGYVKKPVQNMRRACIVAASSIIIVSVSWEIFEIIIGIPIEENYVKDVIIDLVIGALGAFIGLVYYMKIHLINKVSITYNGT